MNIKKVIKIQALYRAIKARKMYEMLVLTTKVRLYTLKFLQVTSKYFTEEEVKETLYGQFKPQ